MKKNVRKFILILTSLKASDIVMFMFSAIDNLLCIKRGRHNSTALDIRLPFFLRSTIRPVMINKDLSVSVELKKIVSINLSNNRHNQQNRIVTSWRYLRVCGDSWRANMQFNLMA